MPIYEFYCPQTNKIYSFYARSLALSGKTPRCPENPDYKMERMMSSFSFTGRAKEPSDSPAIDPAEDARMERAMMEMERDFSGMDEENPDPRALARMMRKMSDLTGEKMPATMEEMIQRMEAGEDPEKLEEEYGDALEDFEPGAGGEGGGEGEGGAGKRRARRKRPERDPTLYEMADYVD
ncbi:cytochrome C [Verrucomicrobiota bacterium sgz303538]